MPNNQHSKSCSIYSSKNGKTRTLLDNVAVEEPMEIRLGSGPLDDRKENSLAITMRTPGHDRELGVGFLFTEGLIKHPDEVAWVTHCSSAYTNDGTQNVLRIELDDEVEFDLSNIQRHFYTSSSCGVCGKASLDALELQSHFVRSKDMTLGENNLRTLPAQLLNQQSSFTSTGGIHAAASFDKQGKIIAVFEDVGRHNALDKLIGHHALNNDLPLNSYGILVSGRSSFELLQKTMMAGCSMLVAIGAPSTLAIEAARNFNITLVGFLKAESFNIYHGAEAIIA